MSDSTVVLPPPEPRATRPPEPRVPQVPEILVAVDDPVACLLIAGQLSAAGYHVAEASDGDEALRRIRELRPALIVLDLALPGADGFEVCRAIRTGACRDAGPPVLILTGPDDGPAIAQAFEAGATDFASKPLAGELLLHRVRFLLRNEAAFSRLRQSEAALESAQRLARLGSWDWHLPSGDFHFSRPALALLQLPPRAAPGLMEYLELVLPEDRAAVRQALTTARGGGPGVDLQHRTLSR